MKIAILGSGAIGGLLAAIFYKNGCDVSCIDKEENIPIFFERGIKLESNFFGDFVSKPKFISKLDFQPDVLFLTVKAPFLQNALRSISPELVENTAMIPLLNGIEHVDLLKERFGKQVIAGTIGCVEAYSSEPGQVAHASKNPPCVTLFSGDDDWKKEKAKKVADLLMRSGLEVAMTDNEKDVLWEKFLRLSALAALTAASGKNLGFLRSDKEWRGILENFLREAETIARSDGATITMTSALKHLDEAPASLKSSLQKDLESGKPSELDALVGSVLRMGEKFHISCSTILNVLNIIKNKYNIR